jgi:peptidyl-prolyl cis-trans isomerase A (cyclophilin A)
MTAILGWIASAAWSQDSNPGANPVESATTESSPTLHPRVKIKTTEGDIVLELDAEKAPITVDNFIRYAKEGFYNGTIFHRVMKDFMIQGGGFTIDMEKKEPSRPGIKNEWKNGLGNKRGTIAMARLGNQPDSATAQFFINVVDNPMLDQPRDGAGYAVFGKVVEGMDVVDKIRNTQVAKHPKYSSPQPVTPVVPVVIQSVDVLSNYNPGKVPVEQRQAAAGQKPGKDGALQAAIGKIEAETGSRVQTTSSGLMYAVVREGTGPSPSPADTVTVHYTGTLLDGTKFDSSRDRGQPFTTPLNRVIPGWTEGVSMMKVGGRRYLIIPPQLGYGARNMGKIPPNSTLVFDVELMDVQQ